MDNKRQKLLPNVKLENNGTKNRKCVTQHLKKLHTSMHVPKHCPKVSKARVISTQNRFEILNSVENIESAFECVDNVAGNKLANTFVDCKQRNTCVSNGTVVNKTAVKSQKCKVTNVVSLNDCSSDKTSQEVSTLDKCQNNCTGELNTSKKSCELNDTALHRAAAKSQKRYC